MFTNVLSALYNNNLHKYEFAIVNKEQYHFRASEDLCSHFNMGSVHELVKKVYGNGGCL